MASINPYVPEHWAHLDHHAQRIETLLEEHGRHLNHVIEALHTGELRGNLESVVTVNLQPQALTRNGRRHNMIWVASTVSCLINESTGWTPVILYAGWNPLDLVEGALITVATISPTTFNCLWRCTDFEMSGALL